MSKEIALAMRETLPVWGIAYSTHSHSPRAKRWYHIARFIYVDQKWWELYWMDDKVCARGNNLKTIRFDAKTLGINVVPGVFTDAPAPRLSNEMVHRAI